MVTTLFQVRCPEGNRPGDRLIISAPRMQNQQYVVTVPPNIRPGQQFRVLINSQEVMVTCPRGVKPGQRVTFQLPPMENPITPAPVGDLTFIKVENESCCRIIRCLKLQFQRECVLDSHLLSLRTGSE